MQAEAVTLTNPKIRWQLFAIMAENAGFLSQEDGAFVLEPVDGVVLNVASKPEAVERLFALAHRFDNKVVTKAALQELVSNGDNRWVRGCRSDKSSREVRLDQHLHAVKLGAAPFLSR